MVMHRRNESIDWFLNAAPGLLGERGISQDPSAGGGPRTVANTSAYHDAMIRAMPHVRRQRAIRRVWERLSAWERTVLEWRYRPRQHVSTFGAAVAFGDLAALALWLAPDRERLRGALGQMHSPEGRPVVAKALREAIEASRKAHDAFERIERELAIEWAEGSIE